MKNDNLIPAGPGFEQGWPERKSANQPGEKSGKILAGGRRGDGWQGSPGMERQDDGRSGGLAGGRRGDGWQGRSTDAWEGDRAVEDCSHVYSDGTLVYGLFEGEQERIAGMNLVAVTAFSCGVKVLMVEIMTTHIHLIISGDYIARDHFAKDFKRKLGKILIRKNASAKTLISVSNDSISGERELMNKIMYVYRNAIVAGWKGMPWDYVGGPGNIFYVNHDTEYLRGKPLSELPIMQARTMFHTKLSLPGDWRVDERGLLLPHCWIDWERVENLFRNPRVFIAFMHQSRDMEASINQESARRKMENLKESELRVVCRKMCQEMFGKAILSKAGMEERLAVAKRIWSERLTYSISALSRVTLLDKSLLESIFCR